VLGDDPVVVEAHHRDHVVDVLAGSDRTRGGALAVGEDRMGDDPPGVGELAPGVLGEEQVRGAIGVQVADLAATELERELPAPPGTRGHTRPGRDLLGDPLACSLLAHRSPFVVSPRGYKFKLA
jgi:hypothetical protein